MVTEENLELNITLSLTEVYLSFFLCYSEDKLGLNINPSFKQVKLLFSDCYTREKPRLNLENTCVFPPKSVL